MERQVGVPFRKIIIAILLVTGILLCLIALGADYLGLDLTPGFGVVQMFELLLGVTCLTIAGFSYIFGQRHNVPRSLQADIGIRLGLTGLVFCYVAGFSDVIGIGTHVEPRFERPFVGPWQMGGIILGILSISVGLLLYHTSRGSRLTSSLNFLIRDDKEGEDGEAEPATEALLAQTDS
jgi:hypothetical protein